MHTQAPRTSASHLAARRAQDPFWLVPERAVYDSRTGEEAPAAGQSPEEKLHIEVLLRARLHNDVLLRTKQTGREPAARPGPRSPKLRDSLEEVTHEPVTGHFSVS